MRYNNIENNKEKLSDKNVEKAFENPMGKTTNIAIDKEKAISIEKNRNEERISEKKEIISEKKEIIKVRDLTKVYKNGQIMVEALKNIDLTIYQGEFIAIMGTSGSGKSTLMNILGCLDRPTSGTYHLEGIEISRQSDDNLSYIRNQKIGFVFQSFNLIPRTSALKNVELPMVYAKMGASERRERAQELLERVGLGARGAHMPNEISGGQKQRVAIARALANKPPIILADEPTGNLDSASSVEIMEIFTRLNEEGNTVIIVTHEPDIAEFTNRIVVFRDGRIVTEKLTERGKAKGCTLPYGEVNL